MVSSSQNLHRNLPEAVLWDLDGTVIDSEEHWITAERQLVESFGGYWTHEDGLALVGIGLTHTAAALQARGVTLSNEDTVANLVDRVYNLLGEQQPWRPNVLELMSQLQHRGVRQGLVTMSYEKIARRVANMIPGTPLEVVVAGDHVSHPKPDPEAYTLAMEYLGVAPQNCIAIEDSPAGTHAASAAGIATIGVQNVVSLSDATFFCFATSLENVSLDVVSKIFMAATFQHEQGHSVSCRGGCTSVEELLSESAD